MQDAMTREDDGGKNRSAFTWNMVAPDEPITSFAPNLRRTVAISQVVAAQCDAQNEDVARFRKERLGRMLLAPEAVPQWVQQAFLQDGEPSLFVEGLPWEALERQEDGTYTLSQSWVSALVKEALAIPTSQHVGESATSSDPEERPHLRPKFLWYWAPEFKEGIVPGKAVRVGGILDELRQLSISLLDAHPMWINDPENKPEDSRVRGLAQATTYVLTQYAPIIDERWFPLRSGKGVHPQSAKHLQLAVFTVQHAGEKLADRMAEWNSQFPEWPYTRTTNFGWDSRQAVRRLLPEEKKGDE